MADENAMSITHHSDDDLPPDSPSDEDIIASTEEPDTDTTETVEATEDEQDQDVEDVAPVDTGEAETGAQAGSNTVVLSSTLEVYSQLLQQLSASKETINTSRHELAGLRQHIRELSAQIKREPRLEGDADSHDLHASKVAVQYDDCGSIIAYAEQVRRNVYDNVSHAEELLSPMSQSMELLKLRVRHIRLLEELLAAQENCLRLEIQQRNADACIWQLADILKV